MTQPLFRLIGSASPGGYSFAVRRFDPALGGGPVIDYEVSFASKGGEPALLVKGPGRAGLLL